MIRRLKGLMVEMKIYDEVKEYWEGFDADQVKEEEGRVTILLGKGKYFNSNRQPKNTNTATGTIANNERNIRIEYCFVFVYNVSTIKKVTQYM